MRIQQTCLTCQISQLVLKSVKTFVWRSGQSCKELTTRLYEHRFLKGVATWLMMGVVSSRLRHFFWGNHCFWMSFCDCSKANFNVATCVCASKSSLQKYAIVIVKQKLLEMYAEVFQKMCHELTEILWLNTCNTDMHVQSLELQQNSNSSSIFSFRIPKNACTNLNYKSQFYTLKCQLNSIVLVIPI